MTAACVRIRPLEDGETGPVLAVFAGLRARSRELRFMAPKLRLTRTDLDQLTHVDDRHRVALVAELPDGQPVGIARYVRDQSDVGSADMAIAVVDRWQRRGIGAQLAGALAERARSAAICRFTVTMLRENDGAFRLMRRAGGEARPVEVDDHSAEFEITLPCGDSSSSAPQRLRAAAPDRRRAPAGRR